MTTHNDNMIQRLRATKERLFEKGWKTGSLGGINGPNCLMGAVIGARNDTDLQLPYATATETAETLVALEQSLGTKVPVFNDAPGRTFDEVIDAIDSCIKSLEG